MYIAFVILKIKKSISASFLAGSLSLSGLAACGSSDSGKIEADSGIETTADENNYQYELAMATGQFELKFGDFYLSVDHLTEDLVTDFLENSDDASKGYLAALQRIRTIDDSTEDFFRYGAELKDLTSDNIDSGFSENDKVLIMEFTPLLVEPMNLVSEFLQVARDAATALSIADKTTWISLQDNLVEIAQKYYETGTARGMLYRSLGENLEDEDLRAIFYKFGKTF
jgi:hypothetical protein